jgi:hypothetical protein
MTSRSTVSITAMVRVRELSRSIIGESNKIAVNNSASPNVHPAVI